MLVYSACLEVNNGSTLDKILFDANALYQSIVNGLKAEGKFIHALLSLEEIPNVFDVGIGKFTAEKTVNCKWHCCRQT